MKLVFIFILLPSFFFFFFFLICLIINFLNKSKQADADGNGTIDYHEFITATMHLNRMDREEHLYTAFQHFDKDNSGYVPLLFLLFIICYYLYY